MNLAPRTSPTYYTGTEFPAGTQVAEMDNGRKVYAVPAVGGGFQIVVECPWDNTLMYMTKNPRPTAAAAHQSSDINAVGTWKSL